MSNVVPSASSPSDPCPPQRRGARAWRRASRIGLVLASLGVLAWWVADRVAPDISYALLGGDPFASRAFDRGRWLAGGSRRRAGMARDVVARHLRTGMSRAAVVDLLGPPLASLSGTDPGGLVLPGAETLAYGLGNWSLYSPAGPGSAYDDAFLYIHLDTAGRVIGARVTGY